MRDMKNSKNTGFEAEKPLQTFISFGIAYSTRE